MVVVVAVAVAVDKFHFKATEIKVLLDYLCVYCKCYFRGNSFSCLKLVQTVAWSPKRIHGIVLFFVCERISLIGHALFIFN